ncbi:MAG TPA: heparinase II/III family protein, partial [Pyrinomonadaceae bacterium]|nr:heparinase II/III family protein [Pyrinomonadaceae bacterium]
RPGFRLMHEYVAHSMLPNGDYVFDFGDIFEGPLTRAHQGDEYPRTHPQGHFNTNYNLLYRLAQRFQSREAQGVADWLKSFGQVNAEEFWSLVWYDTKLKPVPIDQQTTSHYFPDHDVFYWRSDWSKGATAFAFKCGPPEGHHTEPLLKQFPDWRLSSGHAHPDANSFIIFARGQYLTGDTGYAGVPMTEHHNTLLVNGKGQGKEGGGHDAFTDVPYELLNRIRIREVKVEPDRVLVRGDATAAYGPELGLESFVREFVYRPGTGFTIDDEVQTEKPAFLTFLLHADNRFGKESGGRFNIQAGGVKLLIDPTLVESDVRVIGPIQGAIESNAVTAPGPPGAVDKGERQARGEKLLLSTAVPITKARFVTHLTIQN